MNDAAGKGQVGGTGANAVPLYPILSVHFIGTLGFSIVLPFLVFLVTRWGGNALVYGIMGATYSAFQLIGAPILGRWSDRFGRRRILLLSQLGTLASWVIFFAAFLLPERTLLTLDSRWLGEASITLPLVVLFVARAADGLTGGNVSVANAYLADITPDAERSANFGKMAVSSNLGFILGPALAGLLGATVWGEKVPVIAALTISLVACVLIAFRLPESKPCVLADDPESGSVRKIFGQESKPCYRLQAAGDASTAEILRLPGIRSMLSVYFLVMLGFNFFYVAFPVYAVQTLRWSVVETGVFFSVMGLLMALVQGPILARLTRRADDRWLTLSGSLVLAAGFVLFDSPSSVRIYLGVVLLALGNGVMWPSVLSQLSKLAGETYQGTVQGFAGSIGAVASILGLTLGGLIYANFAGRIFWLSAATILATFAISSLVTATSRRPA